MVGFGRLLMLEMASAKLGSAGVHVRTLERTAGLCGGRRQATLVALLTATIVSFAPAARAGTHSPAVAQLINQADQALAAGQAEQAQRLSEQALKLEPNSEEVLNELGLCYVHERQFHQASTRFQQALAKNPTYLPSVHNLGSVLYRSGDYDGAISYFKKELELRHNADADTLVNLADAYRDRANFVGGHRQKDDFDQAYSYYQQAMAVEPNLSTLHNHLGVYYFQRGQFEQSENEINRAIELKSDYSAAYYNLALVEIKRHKLPEAAKAFHDSLTYETDPEYKQQVEDKIKQLGLDDTRRDYLSRASELLSHSRYSEAETLLRQAVGGKGAKDAVAWNNLGYALARQGKQEEAARCYRRAVDLMPDGFPSAEYNLGQTLRLTGDLSGAEVSLKRAVKDSGGMNALAHNALGLIYKQQNRLSAAISEYKLAILQSGDMLPVAHYNLALALEHDQARKGEAASEYKRYLEEAPTGINAVSARQHLAKL